MEKRRSSDSTASNTRRSFLKARLYGALSLSFIFSLIYPCDPAFPSALLDRTAAIVGGRVITYRSMERRYIINRIIDGYAPRLYQKEMTQKDFEEAREQAVRTHIVRASLERLAIEDSADSSREETLYRKVAAHINHESTFEKFMSYYETDQAEIRRIISERISADIFFSSFRNRIKNPTDEEVKGYFDMEKDKKFSGRSFEEMKPGIKRFIENRRFEEMIKRWVGEQGKKIGVKFLG